MFTEWFGISMKQNFSCYDLTIPKEHQLPYTCMTWHIKSHISFKVWVVKYWFDLVWHISCADIERALADDSNDTSHLYVWERERKKREREKKEREKKREQKKREQKKRERKKETLNIY